MDTLSLEPADLYPGWHTWKGVSGVWYARRPLTSPPVILRSATPEGLAGEIRRAEAERAAGRWYVPLPALVRP